MRYLFRHVLMRDAVYGMQLRRHLRQMHRRAAKSIEETCANDLASHYADLAYHYGRAEMTERERHYATLAGEKAAAEFANAKAVRFFSRALDLSAENDWAGCYDLLLERERICDLQGKREAQKQDLTALESLAETLNDDRRRAEVALRRAKYARMIGDFPAAVAAAQMAIRLAQMAQDAHKEAVGHWHWGRVLWHQGELESAQARLERALALAQAQEDYKAEAHSLCELGNISGDFNDSAGALIYYQRALQIYRRIEDREGEGKTLNNIGDTVSRQGNYAKSQLYLNQALSIFRKIGDRWAEGIALGNLSLLSYHLCKGEAALKYSQQMLLIAHELGDPFIEGHALTCLGYAWECLGGMDRAAEAYQQALIVRRESGQSHLAMEPLAGLARFSLSQGYARQAQAQAEEILSYLKTGSVAGTEEPFLVHLTCYQVLMTNHDPRALQVLTSAHNLLQEHAARIPDEATRRSYLENVAIHREIVSLWQATNEDER